MTLTPLPASPGRPPPARIPKGSPHPSMTDTEQQPVRLSLVMTCYNFEQYIRENILSVFAQDYPREYMQLVIVDDASTDKSWDVITQTAKEYGQGWDVDLVRMEKNGGTAAATDAGWSRARHEWIVIMDGDDIQQPDRCRRTAELIRQHPRVGAVICSLDYVDHNGTPYGYGSFCNSTREESPETILLETPGQRLQNLLMPLPVYPKFIMLGCALAIRRQLFDAWGPLIRSADQPRTIQDEPWFYRANLSAPIVGCKASALKYRAHAGNQFNREVRQHTIKAWMDRELHTMRFHRMSLASAEIVLDSIHRATKDPTLTDWNEEELGQLMKVMQLQRHTECMISTWWELPWHKRLGYALHPSRLLPNFRKWPLHRLIPLRLFATLQWLMKHKLRRH